MSMSTTVLTASSAEPVVRTRSSHQKPTVAFLWHGDRNIGGGEYSTWLLARSLPPEYRPILIYGKHNLLVDQYVHDGIEIIQMPLSAQLTGVYRDALRLTFFTAPVYVWQLATATRRLVRIIKEQQISILHPVDNLSKIIAGMAGLLTGVKVVAHCRDELRGTLVERALLLYQRLFMDRIIAVAEKIGDRFSVHGRRSGKVVTIYNGVDLNRFDPDRVARARDVDWGKLQGHVLLAMIAVFDSCKGHRHLLDACAKLKRRGIDHWRCLLVGDGREHDALVRRVRELGLDSQVIFLGYRTDVSAILQGVDLVVIPSDQEAFPRAALEAMAMRKPIVASDAGGLPEAIEHGHTGVIVPRGDVEALADAIERLIAQPETRRTMGRQARERVQAHFSLDENSRRTKHVYRDLLEGPV